MNIILRWRLILVFLAAYTEAWCSLATRRHGGLVLSSRISRSNHTAEQRRPKRDFGANLSIMESPLKRRHCVGLSFSWPSPLALRTQLRFPTRSSSLVFFWQSSPPYPLQV